MSIFLSEKYVSKLTTIENKNAYSKDLEKKIVINAEYKKTSYPTSVGNLNTSNSQVLRINLLSKNPIPNPNNIPNNVKNFVSLSIYSYTSLS